MAQIKLTNVLSDIRGKSNGSVFSSNKQGNYFRTNKIGGGLKSAKWSRQKNKVQFISQQWRLLNDDEQTAWNTAGASMLVKNKVGDLKPISGFQFFNKVNLRNLTIGGGIITMPPVLPSFPDLGEISLSYPDQFQLVLTKFLETNKWVNNQSLLRVGYIAGTSNNYFEADRAISLNLVITPFVFSTMSLNEDVTYFTTTFLDNASLKITLGKTELNEVIFKVAVSNGDSFTYENETMIPYDNQIMKIPFIVYRKAQSPGQLYFDLPNQNKSFFTMAILENQRFNQIEEISFSLLDGEKQRQMLFSDFRISKIEVPYSSIKTYGYGYSIGEEIVTIAFDRKTTDLGFFQNNGESTMNDDSNISEDVIQKINTNLPFNFPQFTLIAQNNVEAPYFLRVFYSNPISWGKSATQGKFSILYDYPLIGENSFELEEQLKKKMAWIPFGASLNFAWQIIDTATGLENAPKSIVAKKKIKFKAGSDLSAKTN